MKKIFLIIIFLQFFIYGNAQRSVFQRITLPKISFELSPTATFKELPSYCADYDRETPNFRARNFDFVHLDERCVKIGNNSPITIQEALNLGFIDFEINSFNKVKVINLRKTDKPINISFNKIVIGDTKGDVKRLYTKNVNERTDQITYWKEQEEVNFFIDNGFLNEKDINSDFNKNDILNKYQKINGLSKDNINQTLLDIEYNSTLKKYLPRKYENLNTIDLETKFIEFYKIPKPNLDLTTTYFGTNDYNLDNNNKIVLDKIITYSKSNPNSIYEISGHADIRGSDEYNQELSEKRTNAVVDYLTSNGVGIENIILLRNFGEKRPFNVNLNEVAWSENRRVEIRVIDNVWDKLIEYGSVYKLINNPVNDPGKLGTLDSRKSFVIEDGDLSHILVLNNEKLKYYKAQKGKDSKDILIIEDRVAKQTDISIIDNIYQKKGVEFSNDEVVFVHIGAIQENHFNILIGKSIEKEIINGDINKNYEDQLINSIVEKINQSKNAKTIIITRDFFVQNTTEGYHSQLLIETDLLELTSKRINPQYLVDKLKTKLPDKNIFLGGDFIKDRNSINIINNGISKDNVSAIQASSEIEYNLITQIKEKIKSNGIGVYSLDELLFDDPIKSKSNILLLTGHKDQKFWEYIDDLSYDVDLDKKVLITFSCFDEGSESKFSDLIRNTKLNSILYFPSEINPDAASIVLIELSKLLNESNGKKSIIQLLDQAIINAHATENSPFLKSEIIKLNNYRIQFSSNKINSQGNNNS